VNIEYVAGQRFITIKLTQNVWVSRMTERLRSGALSGSVWNAWLGVIDPKQHGIVHLLGGYQKSNGHILADICEVNERRDTEAALAGFGGLSDCSSYRTRLAVERPSAASRQLGIPTFECFSGKPTFDRCQIPGNLLQSTCVGSYDSTFAINDKYRPRKGV
jgi:hypothetical protein